MRRFLTLITPLFLAAMVAGNAYAAKTKHHKKEKAEKSHHSSHKERSSKKDHHRSHKSKAYASDKCICDGDTPIIATNTENISPDSLINFAQTLLGKPYNPGSSSPVYGFDCSGFVSYVFKNFNCPVPRSSCEFVSFGERISIEDAKPGDVLLFTGTKSHHPHSIGHVAIVYSNGPDGLKFIHSTSGKEYGVTITAWDDTYQRRFVEVRRLLSQNDGNVLAAQ